jgi:hypothetical protein
VENPLKPQPLIAEVLPGFTILFILACAYFVEHPGTFTAMANSKNSATVISGGLIVILASWIVGTFLDAVRDLIENRLDRRHPVNWAYLLSEPAESIQKLHDSWLAYYFLSGNMAIGLFLVAVLLISTIANESLKATHISVACLAVISVVAFVYGWNFWTLREEIRALIGFGLPHEGVYARIARSSAALLTHYANGSDPGVGVVAIRDIPKGTLIFAPDDDKTIQVSANRIAGLPHELRKLYEDFCPLEKGYYTCPLSFNKNSRLLGI